MAVQIAKTKGSKILKCKPACQHDYQDKKYGVGMRVMNNTRKENGDGYRCTVCGDIVRHGGGDDKKKEAAPAATTKKETKK